MVSTWVKRMLPGAQQQTWETYRLTGERVAAETIYRALFLQARGGLKHEVEAVLAARRAAKQTATQPDVLRTGRSAPKPRTARRGTGQGQSPDMVNIGDRPTTTDEDGHRLPSHHEGDLILGKNGKSAIGTIVERATGSRWLLHLPDGQTADHIRGAVAVAASLVSAHSSHARPRHAVPRPLPRRRAATFRLPARLPS